MQRSISVEKLLEIERNFSFLSSISILFVEVSFKEIDFFYQWLSFQMLRKLLMHPMQLKSTFARSLSRKWNTLYSSLITTYLSYNNIRNERFLKKKKKKKKKETLIRRTQKLKLHLSQLQYFPRTSYRISKALLKMLEGTVSRTSCSVSSPVEYNGSSSITEPTNQR